MLVNLSRDRWRKHLVDVLRPRGWMPARFDEVRAFEEIIAGPFTMSPDEVRGEANAAHASYRNGRHVRLRTVRPDWLAAALDMTVLDDPTVDRATYDEDLRLIRVPPCDQQARSWCVLHEIAEALVGLCGTHPDVQLVTLALAIEARAVSAATQRHGAIGGALALARAHRHLPPWMPVVLTLLESL